MTGSSVPDDCVHVLEEDDPGRDLVRPLHLLRFLLVLAEVARSVEELLGHDGSSKARAGERDTLAGLLGAAALEVLARARDIEYGDLLAVDNPDTPLVAKGDELHAAASARWRTALRNKTLMSPLNGLIASQ